MAYQYPVSIDYCLELVTKRYLEHLSAAIKNKSVVQTDFGLVDGNLVSFSNNHIDRLLIERFPQIFHKNGLPYIELGANDGFVQSNTLLLEKMYGMKGILMEPLPSKYEMLLQTRSTENLIAHGAAVHFNYEEDLVEIYANNLMSVAKLQNIQDDSLLNDLDNISDHIRNDLDPRKNYRCSVPAVSLQSLIDNYGQYNYSLLSLDVEGNEISVLKGIDFRKTSFQLILVETRSLEHMKLFLAEWGYTYDSQVDELNYIFLQRGKVTNKYVVNF